MRLGRVIVCVWPFGTSHGRGMRHPDIPWPRRMRLHVYTTYLGPDGRVGVDAAVQRLKIGRLVLQVHDLVLKVHLLFEERDPAVIRQGGC